MLSLLSFLLFAEFLGLSLCVHWILHWQVDRSDLRGDYISCPIPSLYRLSHLWQRWLTKRHILFNLNITMLQKNCLVPLRLICSVIMQNTIAKTHCSAIINLDQIVTRISKVTKLGKWKLNKSFSFVMYCYLDSEDSSWGNMKIDNSLWTKQNWFCQKMFSALYLHWAPKIIISLP